MANSAESQPTDIFQAGVKSTTEPLRREPRRRHRPHDEVLSWFGNDEEAGRPSNWLDVAI